MDLKAITNSGKSKQETSEELMAAYREAPGISCLPTVAPFLYSPLAFCAVLGLCRLAGLPFELSGLWAGLLAYAVCSVTALLTVAPKLVRRKPGTLLGGARYRLAGYLAVLAILASAAARLPGVELANGPGWRQAVTLAVLAGAYHLPDYPYVFASARRDVPLRLALSAVKLLAICWLGGFLDLRFQVSFSAGVLLFAALTAVSWPLQRLWARSVRTAFRDALPADSEAE
ncbi:hypothetical protein G5C51_04080 [Streptomyces sp. A7024]|uniref:Uncharacterized protein n=1 Tax=Streptomyces coryli TaxID=1128680 RepID=A0A6G4TSX2_9ACTN|nr:hypothetical protein [Streptomyces coryli]